jgi:hypothetical protein
MLVRPGVGHLTREHQPSLLKLDGANTLAYLSPATVVTKKKMMMTLTQGRESYCLSRRREHSGEEIISSRIIIIGDNVLNIFILNLT